MWRMLPKIEMKFLLHHNNLKKNLNQKSILWKTEDNLMKMKVVELQQELKARNLSTSGKKDELQERLK